MVTKNIKISLNVLFYLSVEKALFISKKSVQAIASVDTLAGNTKGAFKISSFTIVDLTYTPLSYSLLPHKAFQ